MKGIARREALQRLGAAALALGASALGARVLLEREDQAQAGEAKAPRAKHDFRMPAPGPEAVALAIAIGKADNPESLSPAALTSRAVQALGGMSRFIARGDIVALKPNIGWDRTPAQGANTNPLVVAELVRLAFDAGAKQVIVSDFSCNDPERSFHRSGIQQAAEERGATVILPAEHRFRAMRLGGEVLDEWPVYVPLVEVDKVINVPVAKHHGLAKFTCALKNWYGIIGGRRDRLHQRIDASIADLAAFMRPTLTVVDATRVLWRNGPQGGNLADTRETNTIIASIDQVAADAYACRLIGLTAADLGYLTIAEKRGLGTTKWEELRRAEI